MYTCPIQLNDVRYNPATQSFEATVTVHDNTIVRSYACAITAPITMSFEEASKGLAKQAARRHHARGGLFSETGGHRAAQRSGRPALDPAKWLQTLIGQTTRHAA